MEIRTVAALSEADPQGRSEPSLCFQAWEGVRLVGSLTLSASLDRTARVSAFVPPEHRRKGLFSALLSEAENTCRTLGAERLLFVCGGESADGRAVAARWGLMLDHSEYLLLLRAPRAPLPGDPALRRARPEDSAAVEALRAAAFGPSGGAVPAGRCWGLWEGEALVAAAEVGPAAEGLSIYGVAVDPARQGRGLGRRLLTGLLTVLPREKTLAVEADGRNRRALALYRSLGFRDCRRQDFFLLAL